MPINPVAPAAGLRPHQQTSYEQCGFEYQEAVGDMASVPLCKCGMFSIGACAVCQTYACGHHARQVSGRFLCQQHADAEEKAAAERARQLSAALEASRRAEEAKLTARPTKETAEEILPLLTAFIREVLAEGSPRTVSYTVSGNWRSADGPLGIRLKRRAKRVADPARIGTHVGDELNGGVAVGWTTSSTYSGVWPALAWLTRWEPRTAASPGQESGSLWFNRDGMVVAGRHSGGMRISPTVKVFCNTNRPDLRVRTEVVPLPSADLFGPIHIDQLQIEHIQRICAEALTQPAFTRQAVARIIAGQSIEDFIDDGRPDAAAQV